MVWSTPRKTRLAENTGEKYVVPTEHKFEPFVEDRERTAYYLMLLSDTNDYSDFLPLSLILPLNIILVTATWFQQQFSTKTLHPF